MTLDKQLENRKAVEKVLGPLVDDIVIPPNDVRRLVEGEVNDAWVKALHETDRRMRIIKEKDPEKIQAVREVLPELEKITHKVCSPSLSSITENLTDIAGGFSMTKHLLIPKRSLSVLGTSSSPASKPSVSPSQTVNKFNPPASSPTETSSPSSTKLTPK
jgi:hypothetical protein